MAVCPRCGRKLRFSDWRPACPGCGVNMIYYDSNRRMLDESEKAEAEHARFQPKIDRAKAAYAGSGWAIMRIVLTLLPVGPLFLPLIVSTGGDRRFSIIGVVERIGGAGVGAVLGKALKEPACLAAALLMVSAVMILVNLILITMSLGRRGKLRVLVTHGLQLLCAVCAGLLAVAAGARIAALFGWETSARLGPGAYTYLALLLLLFAYNVFLLRKGIPVSYTQCLIGGLPSEEYFRCVSDGMSRSQLQRKMLAALAEMEEARARELEEEEREEKEKEEGGRTHG